MPNELRVPEESARCNYYKNDDAGYLRDGKRDFEICYSLLGLRRLDMSVRWLDFGGSSGRIMRHALDYNILPYIADPDLAAALFVNEHLPNIRFQHMGMPNLSPLPYPQWFFHGITALSVFTHTYCPLDYLPHLLYLLEVKCKIVFTVLADKAIANMESGSYPYLKNYVTELPEFDNWTVREDCIFYRSDYLRKKISELLPSTYAVTFPDVQEWQQDVVMIHKV